MKIGLDFDGVIADSSNVMREVALQLYGVDIPKNKLKKQIVISENLLTAEQYKNIQQTVYGNLEYGMKAEPVQDAFKYIEKLQTDGHEVAIVTSRDNNYLEVAELWAKKLNLTIPFTSSGIGKSKKEACSTLNIEIFVDDDLDKLMEIKECVPHLFLFEWSYNLYSREEGVATRVTSWHDLYEKITLLSN